MEIPLQAQVECTDGFFGLSVCVLIDPIFEKITHLVARSDTFPFTEYIVPVNLVKETIAGALQLDCSKADLEKMEPFIKTKFIEAEMPGAIGDHMYGLGTLYYWPYVSSAIDVYAPIEIQQIPPGEISISRGTPVEAADGFVGRVDELVVNPENDRITHLVMREGHLLGKKEVIIPLSAIEKTTADAVFLKLDKHQIEALPSFPVHRRWL